jgi:hypothetical protein
MFKMKRPIIIAIIIVVLVVAGILIFLAVSGGDESPIPLGTSPWTCDENGCCEDDYCLGCYEDLYNCGDFTIQERAQDLYDACFTNNGDIHQLDNDNDGVVCESLP